MAKLSLLLSAGVVLCMLEAAYSMGTYYTYYPDNAAALAYQIQPYSPYMYAPYAFAPVAAPDCDKKKEEGSSSESSSSSSESSEGESKEEGGSKEEGVGSSSSSEEGESKEEGESSSSSSEEGESKEEGKEEKKEKKEEKPLFPPPAFFPPRPAQVIYSAPISYPSYGTPYGSPYKSYSIIQQQPLRASYPYYAYSAPTARVVSSPVSKIISPSAYSLPTVGKSMGYPASGAYWSPSANLAYYKA